jgi:transposase
MVEDSAVVERGLVTAPAEVWALAVRRAEVIGKLAAADPVGLNAADAAAAELGVSRRQVYELVKRWRAGEGLASDLLPGHSSGGRGGERLPDEVEAVIREVLRTRYGRPFRSEGRSSTRARQTVGGSAELGVSAEVQGSDAVRIRVLHEQLTGTGLTGQPRS